MHGVRSFGYRQMFGTYFWPFLTIFFASTLGFFLGFSIFNPTCISFFQKLPHIQIHHYLNGKITHVQERSHVSNGHFCFLPPHTDVAKI